MSQSVVRERRERGGLEAAGERTGLAGTVGRHQLSSHHLTELSYRPLLTPATRPLADYHHNTCWSMTREGEMSGR